MKELFTINDIDVFIMTHNRANYLKQSLDSILNQTIKPVIFYITLPITAISLGLFYPLINVLILYITDFILGNKFEIKGIFIPFFIGRSP